MPVTYLNSTNQPAIEAAVFGGPATDADYLALIGSTSNNLQLNVRFMATIASMNRTFPIHLHGRIPGEWSAHLYFDKPLVYYHSLNVEPNVRAQNIGGSLFTQQAQAADAVGFAEFEGWCTRFDSANPKLFSNGYYAAARWGFDANIPPQVVSGLPAGLQNCVRVSDLMKTQPGRDFWKANGVPLTMKFIIP